MSTHIQTSLLTTTYIYTAENFSQITDHVEMILDLLVRTRNLVTTMRKEKYFKNELNSVK